jgi:transposase
VAKIRSWEVSDEFWKCVEPLVPAKEREPRMMFQRKFGSGRKAMPARRVFEGIVFVLRTECQWKARPRERFGSASSIHRHFRL